jgi:hypothetical protein
MGKKHCYIRVFAKGRGKFRLVSRLEAARDGGFLLSLPGGQLRARNVRLYVSRMLFAVSQLS